MGQTLNHSVLNMRVSSQMQISLIDCQHAQMSLCKSSRVPCKLIANTKWTRLKFDLQ